MWTHVVQIHIGQGSTAYHFIENKANENIKGQNLFIWVWCHNWETWRGTWASGCWLRGKMKKKNWSQWEWIKNQLYLLNYLASQCLAKQRGKVKTKCQVLIFESLLITMAMLWYASTSRMITTKYQKNYTFWFSAE